MYDLKILGSVSPYCKKGLNCPGYLLYGGGRRLLLDCGFGASGRLEFPEDLKDLTIIISHYHKDHYADLFAIKYAAMSYKKAGLPGLKVTVYIPRAEETDEYYPDRCLIIKEAEEYFNIIEYGPEDEIDVGELKVSFFETYHAVKNYSAKISYRGKHMVYSGDMAYRNIEAYTEFIKDAGIFLCECSFLEKESPDNKFHLHTPEAASLAKQANCRELIICHMWPEHDKKEYLEEIAPEFEKVRAAEEGEIIGDVFGV